MKPLISVITPTIPERRDLLAETIENVRAQTYPSVEHVIVSEGTDDDVLEDFIIEDTAEWYGGDTPRLDEYPVRWYRLGRHWTAELSDSYAAAPVMVGQMLARGEYACLWADDERALVPDHIEALVSLLESSGADFAYPKVRMYRLGQTPDEGYDIGTDPPRWGQITHWMYAPSMIEKARGPYRTHTGRSNDWDFVGRAMEGGATWAFLPRVTFQHRADA